MFASVHQLGAAVVAASCLTATPSPQPVVVELLANQPVGGTYALTDLAAALERLVALGVAAESDAGLVLARELTAPQLLSLGWQTEPPTWVTDAASREDVDWAAVPVGAEDLLLSVTDDRDDAEAVLLAVAGHIDLARRAEIGRAGELAALAACRDLLAVAGETEKVGLVRHVAATSDGFGYDVASPVVLADGTLHLEVKTCGWRPRGPWRVYLSRHEVRVARRDPSWRLVVCRIRADNRTRADVLGWCEADAILDLLPVDHHERAWWESVCVEINDADLVAGHPIEAGGPRKPHVGDRAGPVDVAHLHGS